MSRSVERAIFEKDRDLALSAVTSFIAICRIEEAVDSFREWRPDKNLGCKDLAPLHAKAKEHGLRICGSPACCTVVLKKEEFGRNAKNKDGLFSECRKCHTRAGAKLTTKAKHEARVVAAKRRDETEEKKDSTKVENSASAWLHLSVLLISVLGCEFRHDDILTPVSEQFLPDHRKRLFYPIQVKASEANGNDVAFHQCTGYSEEGKETTIVLVHTSSNGDKKVWVLDGRKVTKETLCANPSTGILAKKSLNLKDTPLAQLRNRIMEVAREVGRTTTEYDSFLHIADKGHRTELALMLAVEQVTGMQCRFPDGNQKAFDFWMGELMTQAKTEKRGVIPLRHSVKGMPDHAYSHSDPIDQFLGGSIWKSNGAYWVIYMQLPMWKVVEMGVVDRPDRPANPKQVSVSYGKLAPWLIGGEAPSPQAWNLANSEAYQWKVAKLKDTDRLPEWFLKSVGAKEVADPSKEPSKEECREISTNVGAAIAKEAAGRATAERKRAREEADRAEAAADRAEAAGAGPSTVNYNINNNITNNLNFPEPPSKRFLTDCLSLH